MKQTIDTYEDYLHEIDWMNAGHEDVCNGITLSAMVEHAQDLGMWDVHHGYHKMSMKDVNISFYKSSPSWDKPPVIEVNALARNARYSLNQKMNGTQIEMIPAIVNTILQYADEARNMHLETSVG